MAKKGWSQKRNNQNPKKTPDLASEDMEDEIETFHKQRDVIPLDTNADFGESDEDNEHPVLGFEDTTDDEGEGDDDISDDTELHGVAAKIARTQKFLKSKFGGVDDEMHDDEEEDEEKKTVWGGKKKIYYEDSEVSSSEEEEEEAEVLRLQKERAKALSIEDFGLEDVSQDESDKEPTLEEILVEGKRKPESAVHKEADDDAVTAYQEVEKDINALSKEEQMDVVYSSAPELVGLLAELNDTVQLLESNELLLSKVKERENTQGGIHYLEVKKILLLAYSQAITFYLLLKSEGQPVRDHPIIARLVEIKSMLDKMKQLDGNLPSDLEGILDKHKVAKLEAPGFAVCEYKTSPDSDVPLQSSDERQAAADPMKEDVLKPSVNKTVKQKHQATQIGIKGMEMLKVRAALEEKLKQKGVFRSSTAKLAEVQKHMKPVVNGQLETRDDYDDSAIDVEASEGKLPKLAVAKLSRPKIVSGDDDLLKRDDIGERRRKHELRVLARAGIKSEDGAQDGADVFGSEEETDMQGDSDSLESEDDFYKLVKKQRTEKLAAKAEIYSRTAAVPSLPETVDGKRHISVQIEKNRGLTRARKKLNKNPRKKYRNKHQKAVVRRKGQVRDVRKPSGPYGGETSGINPGVSRSIRFNS